MHDLSPLSTLLQAVVHESEHSLYALLSTGGGPHADFGREIPPPPLLAHKATQAGYHVQQAGGLPPGAHGRPPGLVVRYATCGGLFNQHYCHLTGIAMAIALGAEGVVRCFPCFCIAGIS